MKYLLAALGGFALTLCAFVGGAAFAISYLTAEPAPVQKPSVDASMPLPSDAVKVDTARQDFERIERRPAPKPLMQPEPEVNIDDTITASINDPRISEPAIQSDGHVNWCANQFRSYRPQDNTYTSYSGDIRECISPFSDEIVALPSASDNEASYIEASAGGAEIGYTEEASTGHPGAQHIESCYSRYRSYRPEDNSYQPYGGGPRLQCQ